MRVGLVVPGFSAAPDDWCIPALRLLAVRLAQADDVRVLALRYPYRTGCYEVDGAQVMALGGGLRRGIASASVWRDGLRLLNAEHRRKPFDVLHAFWATESGALAALAGHWLGIPTVVSLAGGELARLPSIGYGGRLNAGERVKVDLALRLANAVTAGSCYQLGLVPHWVRRPRRIPLGVDVSRFNVGAASTGRLPMLVHVASLVPVKDQATLLGAVARLRQPVRLDVVGAGPLAGSLARLASGLGLGDRVRFRGAIDHGLLPRVYQAATLFGCSSLHEAQGMAPLEAAACGVPIVGTAVGVLPELTPDAALTVRPTDPAALADAMACVLGDPARCAAMGRAGRERVVGEFSVEGSVDRFREQYGQLISR